MASNSLLARLPHELRSEVLDRLPITALAAIPVCKLWRGILVRYISDLLQANPGLKHRLVLAGGRTNLLALAQRTALAAVGGYNSRWNNHDTTCSMAEDGPGCELSSEVVCGLGPPYNEQAPPWLTLPNMQSRRADVAVVSAQANSADNVPGSSIMYAIGGREGAVAHRSVERLRVAESQLRGETWSSTAVAPMQEARTGHVALCMSNSGNPRGNGWLLAAGGNEGGGSAFKRSAEFLALSEHGGCEPRNEAWQALPQMTRSRIYACSAFLHGKWFVIGGEGDRPTTPFTVEAFDVWANVWIRFGHLNFPRFQASAVTHRGRILVVGGNAPPEWRDPRQPGWELLSHPGLANASWKAGASAIVHNDELFIVGGTPRASASLMVQQYDENDYRHNAPGVSSRVVLVYDLRRAWHEPEIEPPASGPLDVGRWCGGACVVNMCY